MMNKIYTSLGLGVLLFNPVELVHRVQNWSAFPDARVEPVVGQEVAQGNVAIRP